MTPMSTGRYSLRAGQGDADMAAALTLREMCFGPAGGQCDAFDPRATQVLIHDRDSGALICTYRLSLLHGDQLADSYAAQFYDLAALAEYPGAMLELGRFCVHPGWRDPDILRLAWAGMTGLVDRAGVQLLFGCSSFPGTQPAAYLDAFALLKHRHLAPPRWRPAIRAAEVFPFAARLRRRPDARKANAGLPPLLRTYLMMGGWVSDHAVIDREMDTLHVFTGLEIAAIPDSRKRLLRALAG